MKTDSFFYRFFRQYRRAFFALIGEDQRKARRYKFTEVKELAFRFDGLFLAASRDDDAYFVEVQFQKDRRFYPRFLAEIYVYLAQFKLANDWRAVAIFPTKALDPGCRAITASCLSTTECCGFIWTNCPKKLWNNSR